MQIHIIYYLIYWYLFYPIKNCPTLWRHLLVKFNIYKEMEKTWNNFNFAKEFDTCVLLFILQCMCTVSKYVTEK